MGVKMASSFQSLVPLEVLFKAWEMEVGHTACGLPSSLSLEGRKGRMFSSCFRLTPGLRLVRGGANELARIFFFSLPS